MTFYKSQSIKFGVLSVVSAMTSALGYQQELSILFFSGFVVASIAFIMSAVSLGKDDAERAASTIPDEDSGFFDPTVRRHQIRATLINKESVRKVLAVKGQTEVVMYDGVTEITAPKPVCVDVAHQALAGDGFSRLHVYALRIYPIDSVDLEYVRSAAALCYESPEYRMNYCNA